MNNLDSIIDNEFDMQENNLETEDDFYDLQVDYTDIDLEHDFDFNNG